MLQVQLQNKKRKEFLIMKKKHTQWFDSAIIKEDKSSRVTYKNAEGDEIIEGWVYNWSPDYDYIYLRNSGLIKTEAMLHIKKSKVDIGKNQVATATLVFDEYEDPSSTNYAYIKIDGIGHEYTGGNLTLDITKIYNRFSDDFDIEMQMVTDFGSTKLTLPILQIEYKAYEHSHAVKKLSTLKSKLRASLMLFPEIARLYLTIFRMLRLEFRYLTYTSPTTR
jgi:hypothetical protein